MTKTIYTAKAITRFRLHQLILAVTASKIVKKQNELYYGVKPIQFDCEVKKDRILAVTHMLHAKGILKEADNALFTAGIRTATPHSSNLIEIHKIKESLEFGHTTDKHVKQTR